jgi:imidazole glycerol-phosphate synthase subunit HisF
VKPVRLIGRLDIKNSNLIKSINLEGLRIVGNPNTFAKKYYDEGIDELILMDVVATLYGRNYLTDILKEITKKIFIPITIGGGVRSIEDAKKLLSSGADKVAINSAAVKSPKFVENLVKEIGSQSVVISVEAKKKDNWWEVYTSNGREPSGKNVVGWIEELMQLGAGEILLTSIDREGTRTGFDTDLVDQVSKICKIPLIISGGFGKTNDLDNVLKNQVDAVAIADGIHYGRYTVSEIKDYIKTLKI